MVQIHPPQPNLLICNGLLVCPGKLFLHLGKISRQSQTVGCSTATPSNGAGVNGLAFALRLMQRECRQNCLLMMRFLFLTGVAAFGLRFFDSVTFFSCRE